MDNNVKITIVGIGYVGLSIGVLLARRHKVYMLDIVEKKVNMLNNKKSPIKDGLIQEYLSEKKLDIHATMNEWGCRFNE